MHHPKFFVALADFTLTESRPPRVHGGQVVELLWRYTDVEVGDILKYSPAGCLTVFRQGRIVGQEQVTAMTVRAFMKVGWLQAV